MLADFRLIVGRKGVALIYMIETPGATIIFDESRPGTIQSILVPAPDDWQLADRASPLVNNVKNDGPDQLEADMSGDTVGRARSNVA